MNEEMLKIIKYNINDVTEYYLDGIDNTVTHMELRSKYHEFVGAMTAFKVMAFSADFKTRGEIRELCNKNRERVMNHILDNFGRVVYNACLYND